MMEVCRLLAAAIGSSGTSCIDSVLLADWMGAPPHEARDAAAGDDGELDKAMPMLRDAGLRTLIVVLVVAIVLLVGGTLAVGIHLQARHYGKGIEVAHSAGSVDHAAAIAYARAFDLALVETVGLCSSFLLIFMGTLYVLQTASVEFTASVNSGAGGGALQTSSPGLVMVAVGVVLVCVVILNESSITYNAGPSQGDGFEYLPEQITPAENG